MSESLKWSFSADKCFRRCQRQYVLQYLGAWHQTKDAVRKEAFLLKQVKTPELWHGNLVHRGLELYLVPQLRAGGAINWSLPLHETITMAERQFAFSASCRYREEGMSKAKAKDEYCALNVHESGEDDSVILESAVKVVERAFTNLSRMEDLLAELQGRRDYWTELQVRAVYDAAAIEAHLDLMFFKEFGKPTIVDWKISESQGGGDVDLQTALYAWALCQHPKWRVERAEDCELIEVQLLRQTFLRHRSNQDTFDRLENRIYRSVDRMLALTRGEKFSMEMLERCDFAANPNSCCFCPVKALCQSIVPRHNQIGGSPLEGAQISRMKAHEQLQTQLF